MNVRTYDESTASYLDSVNISVFDSYNKSKGTVASNANGQAVIPDAWLQDKNGTIVFSRAEYKTLSVSVAKFNGNAFLAPSVKTLEPVVVTAKKRRPIKLINPFEQPDKPKPDDGKKFPVAPVIIAGGILLGIGLYFALKKT